MWPKKLERLSGTIPRPRNDGVDDFTTLPHTGAFLRAIRGFRVADITDGLFNTFFVGDRTMRLSYSTWVGGPTGALNPFLQEPGSCGAEVTLLMCHAGPTGPNTRGVFDADATASAHRNGVPFLFGDGSVHFITTLARSIERRGPQDTEPD